MSIYVEESKKAKELYESMIGGCCLCKWDAKEAAIICAEEFMKFAEENCMWDLKDYWCRIKGELEKIKA